MNEIRLLVKKFSMYVEILTLNVSMSRKPCAPAVLPKRDLTYGKDKTRTAACWAHAGSTSIRDVIVMLK